MKIMNLLKHFTALCLLMVFSYSCEDLFYVDDREKLTEEIVINKENDVRGMWANLYHYLENGFTYIDNALLANACDEADMNNPGSQVYKYNNGSWNAYDNPDNRYSHYFTALRNAMNFLELTDTLNNPRFNYESYRISDPVKFNTLKRELKAYRIDAKFFSAYYHFELWKRFGEIPVVVKVLSDADAGNLERKSTEEVVNHIITLLDEIIPEFDELELMPESEYMGGAWNGNNIGRITKGAALALKCRTLLYAASPLNNDGQYNTELCDRAARTAADIINLGIYSTEMDYRSIHQDKTLGNKENILDMRVDNQDFNYLEVWNVPPGGNKAFITPDVCRNATCPSQNLVDAYETVSGDPVNEQNPYEDRDPRLKMSILTNGDTWNVKKVEAYEGGKDGVGAINTTTTGYYLKKFLHDRINLNNNTVAPHIWTIFRYGEVLLNYAEAMYYAHGPEVKMGYVTNGSDLSALDAINQIRQRPGVNMPQKITVSETEIRNERRVELAFEGHRFWDVRRWMIAGETESHPLIGMRITKDGESFSYQRFEVEKRVFEPKMYRFPIPQVDIINFNWTQNPGW